MLRLGGIFVLLATTFLLAIPLEVEAAQPGLTRRQAAQLCRQERVYYRGMRITRAAGFQGCLRRHGFEPRRPLRI